MNKKIYFRKLICCMLALLLTLGTMLTLRNAPVYALTPPALQFFYLTLPEDVMLQYFWDNFGGNTPVSPIRSVTSISIGTSGTVIYYDQWEDNATNTPVGYDSDIANPGANTYNAVSNPDGTQIWGDGVLANGCPPSINNTPNPCAQPGDDTLSRGMVITLDNQVVVNGSNGGPYNRNAAQIFFDGRDKIASSLPVAVTRALWPSGPGSLVADAQAVPSTEKWGLQYLSPVGENNTSPAESFQEVRLLIMAGAGGATINVDANADGDFADLYDRNGYVMSEGEVLTINDPGASNGANSVKAGVLINVVAGNPVQVTLLTSDTGSTYENRFYNLIPRADWVNNYYSPVGSPTTVGTLSSCTNAWIYNPNGTAINVSYDFAGGGSPDGFLSIPANSALAFPNVPNNSAARYYTAGGQVFLPISLTDCTNGSTGNAQGNIFDWGHELYPVDQLSPELLIGWAPGCSDESYQGVCLDSGGGLGITTSRSFVWVTPLQNANIYIDKDGSGISCPGGGGAEQTIAATALNAYRIGDDPTARGYVHDNLNSVAYNRPTDNQGAFTGIPVPSLGTWASNWTETGDDGAANAGMIYIPVNTLRFRDNGSTNETNISLQRSVNLSGQDYSRLSFKISFSGTFDPDDAIAVEVSPNGGTTWTTLETIQGPISYPTAQLANRVYRTTAYNSVNTTFRFRTIGNLEAGEYWEIDEVHVDYATGGDFDMTGAYIRTCPDEPSVGSGDILLAAAFGQNPASSYSGDDEATDLGMGVPPYGSQIRITKDADRSFASPGDLVTYNYTVKLIQTFSTAVNNVEVKDDRCSPATYVSGDTANPGYLDPGETWNFTCTGRMYADTTNYAMALALYGTDRIRSNPAFDTVLLTSSIGDYVWVDEDGDGDQDAGEPGIPNVRVTLTGTNMDGGAVSLVTYTDANGRYLFKNVPPSNASGYTITVDTATLPAGLRANPTYDENGIGTPHTTTVVIRSGVEYVTADFGYNWATPNQTNNNTGLGAIGDRVWIDANGNGRQDPGEPGLYGVTVQLLTAGSDGILGTGDDVVAATTITDYAGNYIFDDIAAGAYAVRIPGAPSGYTLTGDPDQPNVACTACDGRTTTPVLLAPGDVYLNADFGFQPDASTGATIGDTLWVDTNRNNLKEGGEPALANVTVSLIRDLNNNGIWDAGEPIIATTYTNASGQYAFTGVPVADGVGTDDYLVWVNDTANVLGELAAVYDDNGAAPASGLVTGLGISRVADLTPAGNLNQDFAYAPAAQTSALGLIGDTVWFDLNNNGVFDPGEGLEGVIVNLFQDTNNNGIYEFGEPYLGRTTTSENGQYFFGGLPAGTYTVDIDLATLPNYGTGLTNFVDPDGGTPHRAVVTLATGQVRLDQDFGYRAVTGYAISGTIWNDRDANGTLAGGETGRFQGVTVALYTDSNDNGVWDAGDKLVGATTTDASGNYSFANLPNDRYFVDVTDDARILNGFWKSNGASPGSDNNSQVDFYTIVLSGANNSTADFGYYRDPAALGDFVWQDTNRNGLQDAGEPGLAGVTVTLTITWSGGAGSTTLTTLTDANGYYTFGNLLLDEDFDGVGAGEPTYALNFSTPIGYEPTTPNAGDDTIDSDGNAAVPATVTQGVFNDTLDSGFRLTVLTIAKTSSLLNQVYPGDTYVYTITVTNNTAIQHTGIAITDPLIAGAAYIANSTVATGYIFDSFFYFDDFASQSYSLTGPGSEAWGSNWTEVGEITDPSAGSIQVVNAGWTGGSAWYLRIQTNNANRRVYRQADMSTCNAGGTLTYDYNNAIGAAGRTVTARIYDGATLVGSLATYNSTTNTGIGSASFTLTAAQMTANTRISFDVTANGTGANYLYVDNVRFTCNTKTAASRDNASAGFPDLQQGAQPNLVVAADKFGLDPGESMVVTFRVTANDPNSLASIDNTASVVSTQQPTPRSASVSNPLPRAAIGNSVWLDEDGNGIQDAGEAGIPNVTVQLWNADHTAVVATTTTDARGNYIFKGVLPGTYQVDILAASLPAGLAPTTVIGGNADFTSKAYPYTLTVTAGVENLTADFGFNWASAGNVNGNTGNGAIGDRVWIDANGNGRQDPGEAGLAGVTVELVTAGPDGLFGTGDDVVLASQVTDAAGNYVFYNLPAGAYVVRIPTPPAGYTQTGDPDNFGATGANDHQTTTPIVLAPGDVFVNADFGYQPAAGYTIGDRIFRDVDGNGSYGGSDTGIPGVTVALLDNNNNVIATTVTDHNGLYAFPGLPNGTYTVWVNDTANVLGELTQTSRPNNAADNGQPCGTCNNRNTVTLSGANNLFQDFGYAPAGHQGGRGLIGDTIFRDANSNNTADPGEGMEGVIVRLYNSAGTILLATTVTDENGNYTFGNLPDGTYLVRVTPPAGYSNTYDPDGGNNNQSSVTIAAGNRVNPLQDFGYRGTGTTGVIGNLIWNDRNANGVVDTGETGLDGVTVALYQDRNANGVLDAADALVGTTVTSGGGAYSFTGLATDDGGANAQYFVHVTDASGLLAGWWASTGTPGADNNSQAAPYAVTLTPGSATNNTADFGYYRDPAALGDRVWEDLNGNGIQDAGEPGLAGVLVTLTITWPGGAGSTTLTTVTDAGGYYSFGNLLLDEDFDGAGGGEPTFQITFTAPSGYAATLSDQTSDDLDSDGLVVSAQPVKGAANTTYDLGLVMASVIGDRIWLDVDGDGVQDVGEPGLPNVTVWLYNPGTDGQPGGGDDVLIATTTTDANGNYLFTGVTAGSYYVQVNASTLPAGLTASPGTSNPTATFAVTGGNAYLDKDFGYKNASAANAIIGDFVWSDYNQNGIQDPGEPGVAGVAVTLKGSGGDTVATTTTGPDGRYLFANVAPGQYRVEITLPSGYLLTSGPQSSANPTLLMTAQAGGVYLNADFGLYSPATYAITDRLWRDNNFNGVVNSNVGETGIGGVTVNLLDSAGKAIATTTSGPDGTFTFSGVPNGNYTIQIADNANALSGLSATTPAAHAGQLAVTVNGAPVAGEHFGYARPGAIGSRVWQDTDGNGMQDPGEPGLAGVTVALYTDPNGDGDPADGILVDTQTTGPDGRYLFTGLPDGNYVVVVTPPSGYTQTGDPDESGLCATCDHQIAITLAGGVSFLNANFGYRNTALADISGSVWNDLNRNARDDGAGEPPIAGVTIALLDSSDKVIATTVTASDGSYTFYDVPAGNYTVQVTDQNNVLAGYQLTSGLDAIPVTVVGTTSVSGVDFGYVRNPATGVIGDRIWHDANRDGVQNSSEPGIANVTVWLKAAAPIVINGVFYNTGATIATTTTDLNGNYLFTSLPAGSYSVDVDGTTLPSGLAATTGTTDPRAVTLTDGQVYLDADFGYASATGVALGDRVWHDVNGDGIQDPGEPGIGGVTVQITPPSTVDLGNGAGQPVNVTTDPDGSWLITGLPAGNYKVTVTPPTGYNTTPTNGAINRDYTIPDTTRDILYADFGFNGGPTVTIGDRIWLDANGDGVQDGGESGIPGVTVNLVNAGGVIIATTTTDANGVYLFSGVPDGTYGPYTVRVTDVGNVLAGRTQTGDPDSTMDGATEVIVNGGAVTSVGGIACSNCNLSADFGYQPSGGIIGNQVWRDLDGDGFRDAGEPGVEGVTIALWRDVNGDGVITPGLDNLVRVTVTDQNGQYTFTGLPAGKYLVDVTDKYGVLAGFTKTSGTAGADNHSQADPYPVELTLTGGVVSSNFTADFGYDVPVNPLTISGIVFGDTNNNGSWATGEPLIPGATLSLYRVVDGEWFLIGTTTSAPTTGYYEFTDLPEGDYVVVADVSNTSVSGKFQTTQTGTNAIQPVTLSNANSANNDFGFHSPPFHQPTAVTLAAFTAAVQDHAVLLTWETAQELDNLGFNLYRGESAAGPWTRLNAELIPAQHPGAVFGATYTWLDEGMTPGATYFYRLEDVNVYGASTFHGPISITAGQPSAATVTGFTAHNTSGLSLGLLLAAALTLVIKRRR